MKVKHIKRSDFLLYAGILFILIGTLHLLRSLFSWQVIIGNFIVPVWWSYLAVVLAALMAYHAFKFRK